MYNYFVIALIVLVFFGALYMYINYCVKYEFDSLLWKMSNSGTDINITNAHIESMKKDKNKQPNARAIPKSVPAYEMEDLESYIDPVK